MPDIKCDFCPSTDARWRYPANDFRHDVSDEIAWTSIGDWAACEECARYIEINDAQGLTDRAIGLLGVGMSGYIRRQIAARVLKLHEEVMVNISGPRKQINDA